MGVFMFTYNVRIVYALYYDSKLNHAKIRCGYYIGFVECIAMF